MSESSLHPSEIIAAMEAGDWPGVFSLIENHWPGAGELGDLLLYVANHFGISMEEMTEQMETFLRRHTH